jgi:hypothetical protein
LIALNYQFEQSLAINNNMSFFRKLFSSGSSKDPRPDALAIYLDADLKKSIEAKDQLVREYEL